jgi:hypothetical protein
MAEKREELIFGSWNCALNVHDCLQREVLHPVSKLVDKKKR